MIELEDWEKELNAQATPSPVVPRETLSPVTSSPVNSAPLEDWEKELDAATPTIPTTPPLNTALPTTPVTPYVPPKLQYYGTPPVETVPTSLGQKFEAQSKLTPPWSKFAEEQAALPDTDPTVFQAASNVFKGAGAALATAQQRVGKPIVDQLIQEKLHNPLLGQTSQAGAADVFWRDVGGLVSGEGIGGIPEDQRAFAVQAYEDALGGSPILAGITRGVTTLAADTPLMMLGGVNAVAKVGSQAALSLGGIFNAMVHGATSNVPFGLKHFDPVTGEKVEQEPLKDVLTTGALFGAAGAGVTGIGRKVLGEVADKSVIQLTKDAWNKLLGNVDNEIRTAPAPAPVPELLATSELPTSPTSPPTPPADALVPPPIKPPIRQVEPHTDATWKPSVMYFRTAEDGLQCVAVKHSAWGDEFTTLPIDSIDSIQKAAKLSLRGDVPIASYGAETVQAMLENPWARKTLQAIEDEKARLRGDKSASRKRVPWVEEKTPSKQPFNAQTDLSIGGRVGEIPFSDLENLDSVKLRAQLEGPAVALTTDDGALQLHTLYSAEFRAAAAKKRGLAYIRSGGKGEYTYGWMRDLGDGRKAIIPIELEEGIAGKTISSVINGSGWQLANDSIARQATDITPARLAALMEERRPHNLRGGTHRPFTSTQSMTDDFLKFYEKLSNEDKGILEGFASKHQTQTQSRAATTPTKDLYAEQARKLIKRFGTDPYDYASTILIRKALGSPVSQIELAILEKRLKAYTPDLPPAHQYEPLKPGDAPSSTLPPAEYAPSVTPEQLRMWLDDTTALDLDGNTSRLEWGDAIHQARLGGMDESTLQQVLREWEAGQVSAPGIAPHQLGPASGPLPPQGPRQPYKAPWMRTGLQGDVRPPGEGLPNPAPPTGSLPLTMPQPETGAAIQILPPMDVVDAQTAAMPSKSWAALERAYRALYPIGSQSTGDAVKLATYSRLITSGRRLTNKLTTDSLKVFETLFPKPEHKAAAFDYSTGKISLEEFEGQIGPEFKQEMATRLKHASDKRDANQLRLIELGRLNPKEDFTLALSRQTKLSPEELKKYSRSHVTNQTIASTRSQKDWARHISKQTEIMEEGITYALKELLPDEIRADPQKNGHLNLLTSEEKRMWAQRKISEILSPNEGRVQGNTAKARTTWPHTLEAGETWATLAEKYNVDINELAAANSTLVKSSVLPSKSVINIPVLPPIMRKILGSIEGTTAIAHTLAQGDMWVLQAEATNSVLSSRSPEGTPYWYPAHERPTSSLGEGAMDANGYKYIRLNGSKSDWGHFVDGWVREDAFEAIHDAPRRAVQSQIVLSTISQAVKSFMTGPLGGMRPVINDVLESLWMSMETGRPYNMGTNSKQLKDLTSLSAAKKAYKADPITPGDYRTMLEHQVIGTSTGSREHWNTDVEREFGRLIEKHFKTFGPDDSRSIETWGDFATWAQKWIGVSHQKMGVISEFVRERTAGAAWLGLKYKALSSEAETVKFLSNVTKYTPEQIKGMPLSVKTRLVDAEASARIMRTFPYYGQSSKIGAPLKGAVGFVNPFITWGLESARLFGLRPWRMARESGYAARLGTMAGVGAGLALANRELRLSNGISDEEVDVASKALGARVGFSPTLGGHAARLSAMPFRTVDGHVAFVDLTPYSSLASWLRGNPESSPGWRILTAIPETFIGPFFHPAKDAIAKSFPGGPVMSSWETPPTEGGWGLVERAQNMSLVPPILHRTGKALTSGGLFGMPGKTTPVLPKAAGVWNALGLPKLVPGGDYAVAMSRLEAQFNELKTQMKKISSEPETKGKSPTTTWFGENKEERLERVKLRMEELARQRDELMSLNSKVTKETK